MQPSVKGVDTVDNMYVESTLVSNRNFDVATTTSIQRWLLSRRRRDALSTSNRRWFDVVCPSAYERTYGDPPAKFNPCIPSFKVTQGHSNQRGSICYLWLSVITLLLLLIYNTTTVLKLLWSILTTLFKIRGYFGLKITNLFYPVYFTLLLTG